MASSSQVPPHVSRAVESIAALHSRAMQDVGRHQKTIERLTGQVGRPRSLYLMGGLVLGWVALNGVLLLSGRPALDPPPFPALQCCVSVAALLIGTMVLTSQNRQTRHSEQRSQLDLEVNLQAEAKVTKLIQLLEELRRDMPSVPNRVDLVAREMQEVADPHRVLSALEKRLEEEED
jgi:uncharacterized membrane protein